jgi:transmembrane sensor
MSREAFHLLLEKYLQDRCTDEEKEIVEKWYGMLDKQDMEDVDATEINMLEQKLWERVHKDAIRPVVKFSPSLRIWAAAAIAGFILLAGYAFFVNQSNAPKFMVSLALNQLKEYRNSTDKEVLFKLEDGSQVTLQPKASLKYPIHFSKSLREVSLEGEGFFQISKNPERPFLVYNKNVITRVVGTSFIVKNNGGGNETEVIVKTGKVIVSANSENLTFNMKNLLKSNHEVVLSPNQKTVYNAAENTFATTLVDRPLPIDLKENKQVIKESYSFNDTRVAEVLNRLQIAYGVEIVVEDKALYNYTFTGDLSEQSLYNQLDFLCESIKANYRVEGTKIVISTNQ